MNKKISPFSSEMLRNLSRKVIGIYFSSISKISPNQIEFRNFSKTADRVQPIFIYYYYYLKKTKKKRSREGEGEGGTYPWPCAGSGVGAQMAERSHFQDLHHPPPCSILHFISYPFLQVLKTIFHAHPLLHGCCFLCQGLAAARGSGAGRNFFQG